MKMFSGFIVIAIALAAQLPYLTAAPYPDALSRLLAIAETMAGSKVNHDQRKASDANLQQIRGVSSIDCFEPTDQFLLFNPQLNTLQRYSEPSRFGMLLDCSSTGGDECSTLSIEYDWKFFDIHICYSQHRGMLECNSCAHKY